MTGQKLPSLYACIAVLAAFATAGGAALAGVAPEVLLTEDFEGDWASRAGAWKEESRIKLEQDTTEARSGNASLRLSPVGRPPMCYASSPRYPGERGVNYRISFWVKATDRVKMVVQDRAGNFPQHVHWTGFVTTLKWRKITYGGRISRTGYTGVKPVKIQFQVHNNGKPVTVWIDDLVVERGADFVTDAGWTAVAEGKNLIPNASFEVDPSRHYLQWNTANDRGPDTDWQFSDDAAFGSRSLKIRPSPGVGWIPGPPLEMIHPLAFDSGDAEFTMSASVKIAGGRPEKVTLVLGPPNNFDVPIPKGSFTLEMTPTGQWTRHETTFRLPRADNGKYYFYIRGSNVLLDGVMLARGKSVEFRPRQSVEATLRSARPWRIYTPEEALDFTLRAVRHDRGAPQRLRVTLVNFRGRTVRKLRWKIDAKVGQVAKRKITLDPMPWGCYRAELRVPGRAAVLSEITFSVLPEPRRVPYMKSNWGVDTAGGIHWNTHDWDLSPMILRLGFHWARVWSPMCLEDVGYAYEIHRLSPEQGLRAAHKWLDNLKRHGFGIYASVHPRFKYHTRGEHSLPPKTEEEYADYEANLREIVARFGDRIDRWEVGNEPCLPDVTPGNYGRMVRETVRVLDEIKPDAKIVSLAGAADGDKEWIEFAFKAGAGNGVEGISFHYGGQTGADTVERYRQWREWALRNKERPLEAWDSEESTDGPPFYPVRVQTTTGLGDLIEARSFTASFCGGLKIYLCNSAMNVRTICFNAEYQMRPMYTRGFFERDGGLKPAMVATFLAAQLIQTMKGGGLYRTPDGLFIALVHDDKQSVLAVWSEKYTGTALVMSYADPFDMLDQTPRSIEDLAEVPDFYRDAEPVKVSIPRGVKVLDAMRTPVKTRWGRAAVGIYPMYLVIPRDREAKLLRALGAKRKLEPLP